MTSPDVIDLVAEWERRVGRGEPVTPEALCADCPELLPELRDRINDLARVNQALGAWPDAVATHPQDGAPEEDLPDVPLDAGRLAEVRFHARGGLGEVFTAHDPLLNRRVAVKTVQARFAAASAQLRRFTHEAEITAQLDHPGVVPVYARGRAADGRPCFVMRFIEGESLRDAIGRVHGGGSPDFRGSDFRQLLGRFIVVCQTVAYAHSRGVIHRDIKPGNIMLGKYGETLVVDWGLAKSVGTDPPAERAADRSRFAADAEPTPDAGATPSNATTPGVPVGTPAYMAPEQAAGDWDRLGPACDVYGLGATLYHLLTGRTAFRGNHYEVLDQVESGTFPLPRTVNPAVPRALEAITLKSMALRPEDRYTTPLHLADDLQRWMADEPATAWREPLRVRLRRWGRRHRAILSAATVGLCTAVVALAVGLVVVKHKSDEIARQRDVAREQKRRTREALDAMTSDESIAWLAGQRKMTAQQAAFLERALAYYQDFAAEVSDGDDGRDMAALAHLRVGTLLHKLQRFADAEPPTRRAVELGEALVADRPDVADYRMHLAKAYSNWSEEARALRRPADVDAALRRAHELAAGLTAEDPGNREYQAVLANILNNQGINLWSTRRYQESARALRAALKIREELAADSAPAARVDLGRTLNNLANTYKGLDDGTDAEAASRTALDVFRALAREFPAVREYKIDQAMVGLNLGILLRELKRYNDADAPLREALDVVTGLLHTYPGTLEYREMFANVHNSLANNDDDLDKPEQAKASYQAALAIREELHKSDADNPVYRRDLAGTRLNLGIITAKNDPAAALPWFDRAAEMLAPLVAKQPTLVQERQFLSSAYSSRAEALEKLGRFADAVADYDRAIQADTGESNVSLRVGRAGALTDAGDLAQAEVEVAALAALKQLGAEEAHDCAGVLVKCAAAAQAANPPRREAADALLTQAVTLLGRASAEPRVVIDTLTDTGFKLLYGRDDYAMLLADVAETP